METHRIRETPTNPDNLYCKYLKQGYQVFEALSVYNLIPSTNEQLDLFASPTHAVSKAMDKINDRWGEFVSAVGSDSRFIFLCGTSSSAIDESYKPFISCHTDCVR